MTEKVATKKCVIHERLCIQCGECLFCDLDLTKICDNCMLCLKSPADFRAIAIDAILVTEDESDSPEK